MDWSCLKVSNIAFYGFNSRGYTQIRYNFGPNFRFPIIQYCHCFSLPFVILTEPEKCLEFWCRHMKKMCSEARVSFIGIIDNVEAISTLLSIQENPTYTSEEF